MYYKAILNYFGTLKFAPQCFKNKKMCDKVVDNYAHALGLITIVIRLKKVYNKAVNAFLLTIQFVPKCYKDRGIINKIVYIFLFYLALLLIDIRV